VTDVAHSHESMRTHFIVVAAVHAFLGAVKLVLGLAVVLPAGLFTTFWVASAFRFWKPGGGGESGEAVVVAIGMSSVGVFGLLLGVVVLLLSLPDLVTASGVLLRRPWAPMVALLTSMLTLFNAPIGTTIGLYTIWALWSREGREAF
jgi:hypothetical protein